MIPKIIHYCWFGRNSLPESAIKCINSWKKFLPDYEIKEWNEDNFDVNIIQYTHDAYEAKKYAFVSDYARFWILYKYGGLYFDTDVEVIKPMDDIIESGAFVGCEIDGYEKEIKFPIINPGLGFGAEPCLPLFKKILNSYENLKFILDDGNINPYSMIPMISQYLRNEGLLPNRNLQEIARLTIYPAEYFNPLDSATGRLKVTDNTRSIHWYMGSWQNGESIFIKKIKQYIRLFISIFKK